MKRKPVKLGRPPVLGGERLNFFPGAELSTRMTALEKERKALKLPYAFTKSYICRLGIELFCSQVEALFAKAKRGDLHARKRVEHWGQKLKKYEDNIQTPA